MRGAEPPKTIRVKHAVDAMYVYGYIDDEGLHVWTQTNGWCKVADAQGIVTAQVLNLKSSLVEAVAAAYPDVAVSNDYVQDLQSGYTIPGWSSYIEV